MLSYEKIREIERNERESKQLQKLPDNFIEDLKEYLRRKEKIGDKTSSDMLELQNVKNTIRRIFELREHKIIELVLYSVRTGMPVENLTKREEALFYQLVDHLKRFRESFYEDLAKEPVKIEVKIEHKEAVKEEKKEIKKEIPKKPMYRVIKTLPAFIGPDMKTYELKAGQIVELPEPLDRFLLEKGIVERG